MEINRNNINEIINKANLKPDKDYGQNFLVETSICERIVAALEVENNERVLEIGPGLGSLTHYLAKEKGEVTAVDIDQRMIDFLTIVYKDENNVKIVQNDIRKQDVSEYEKIIGNLPYNITTETIQYLLLNASKCKRMVFMIQNEAFNRFSDLKGKDYGPYSVLIHLLGTIKRLFTVRAGSFYPVPKCDSVVFSIDITNREDYEVIKNTFLLTKTLFLNRRKTIANNMLNVINDKDIINKVLNDLNIKSTTRPEEISPEQFKNLYIYFSNNHLSK